MNLKSILTLLLVIFILSACATREYRYTAFDKNISNADQYKSLIIRSRDYWEFFSQKNFDESYKFELPYQNYKHDLQWYKSFHAQNRKNYKITLIKILSLGDDIIELHLRFNQKDKSYVFTDKWIEVNKQWYHKYNDSLIPNFDY